MISKRMQETAITTACSACRRTSVDVGQEVSALFEFVERLLPVSRILADVSLHVMAVTLNLWLAYDTISKDINGKNMILLCVLKVCCRVVVKYSRQCNVKKWYCNFLVERKKEKSHESLVTASLSFSLSLSRTKFLWIIKPLR